MIRGWTFALLVLVPQGEAVRVGPADAPPALASAKSDLQARAPAVDRAAILAVDPKLMPRGPADSWKGFDITNFDDKSVLSALEIASAAIRRGDFVLALGEMHAILSRVPDFPPALHMSGVLYYRLQRYGDSAHCFARYVEIAPERVGDTRMLGHDLYSLGRYEEARAHYLRVLAVAPSDFEALRGLALTEWRLGDGEGALEKLERAAELAPRNDEAWSWMASIAFDLGDLKRAREAAERAISMDALESRTWFTLARILEELGQSDAAKSARLRFESLSRSAALVRGAEKRLLADPEDPVRFVAWLDACVAHGSSGEVRNALQRLARIETFRENLDVRRAELDACLYVRDVARGGPAALDLERLAGADTRSWRTLRAWFALVGDPAGVARAESHLGK